MGEYESDLLSIVVLIDSCHTQSTDVIHWKQHARAHGTIQVKASLFESLSFFTMEDGSDYWFL